jgi:hypothetical protein
MNRVVGVVMVWQVAAVPMSCYIIRSTTTRTMTTESTTESHAVYLRTLWPLGASQFYVSTELPIWDLRGTAILRFHGVANLWSVHVTDTICVTHIFYACLSLNVSCIHRSSQFHFWTFGIYCERKVCYWSVERNRNHVTYVNIYVYVWVWERYVLRGFTRLDHVLHCVFSVLMEISCIVNSKFLTYVFTVT